MGARPAPQTRPFHDPAGPFLVAHRGASDAAPENTLPAFDLALAAGAPVLECDVHLSADGVPIVIHDATLERTTGRRGRVAAWSWKELSELDASYPRRWGDRFAGTRVPRLHDLMSLARGRATVMVEIKREAVDDSGEIEAAVLEAARSTKALGWLGVISMSFTAVARVRALQPDVPTGYVLRTLGGRDAVSRCRKADVPFLIGPSSRWLRRPGKADEARAAGLRLGAYVVNDAITLERLLALGVESLATDRPAEMAPLLP